VKPPKHVFATFPEFSRLTYADREKWETLIKDYPPISDISFTTLMTWWSVLENTKVSQINGNIIIAYYFPGYEAASGLSILGTKRIDESICSIFDWQKERGDPPCLVHVPEFVISAIRFPEMFNLESDRNFDECIFDLKDFTEIKSMPQAARSGARRLEARMSDKNNYVKDLELGNPIIKELILHKIEEWNEEGGLNQPYDHDNTSLGQLIDYYDDFEDRFAGAYINGELHAFVVYRNCGEYLITTYARFSYAMPHIFEFNLHQFAVWFYDQGFRFVNLDVDAGHPLVRAIKVNLQPVNFFRKYTITPKRSKR